MTRTEVDQAVAYLRERPGVCRLMFSAPLDVYSARKAGAIARSLNYHPEYRRHWDSKGQCVDAWSRTNTAGRARVWARWVP